MKYTRAAQNESAVSFLNYIESLERRRQEDLERYERDRQKSEEDREKDLARYEKDRQKSEERVIRWMEQAEQRRKEDHEKAEQRRKEDHEKAEQRRIADTEKIEQNRKDDFANFQAEIATFKVDLQKTFRNNIFIPFIVALIVVIAGLLLPVALSNWRDFVSPPQVQAIPTIETATVTE
ncbi:MAG: hypothetical protein FWG65_05160, partial [Turicibacter sp.]|nr:hypothetical protein [Turicibacter sp.]